MGHAPEFREGRKGFVKRAIPWLIEILQLRAAWWVQPQVTLASTSEPMNSSHEAEKKEAGFTCNRAAPEQNYCENTRFCKVTFLCFCLENWLFKGKFLAVLTKINNIFYNTIISHFIGFSTFTS